MATLFAPLRCVATAALFALVVSVLARADEHPGPSDEAFDAALGKAAAAKVGEADFRESLRSVALRFSQVKASSEPGKGEWSELTLNARGKRVDAIRVRTPAGEKRDLVWAVTLPKSLDRWYIMPVEGEMEGFRNFWKADGAALFGKDAPDELKQQSGVIQTLEAKRLEPGKEYLIWFVFKDDQPAPTWLTLSFLPPGKSGSVKSASTSLGLPRTPEPAK